MAGLINPGSVTHPEASARTAVDAGFSFSHLIYDQPIVVRDTLRPPSGVEDTLGRNVMLRDTTHIDREDPDILRALMPDIDPEQDPAKIIRYAIPEFRDPAAFEPVLDDSTLRWMQLLNIAGWYNYRSGVILNRLGGLGRPDAVFLHGHSPVMQRIYFEGLPAGDPVTGLENFNRLQMHHFSRVYEQTGYSHAETRYSLRRYYLIRPLTRINFGQGPDGLMSTEGLVSFNLNHRTNVEMSLWNMSDAGYYPRSDFSGLQSNLAVHHQYNSRFTFRAGLYYNTLQMEESGGYQGTAMENFPFDRFLVSPVLPNARSSVRQTLLRTDAYYRPAEDKPVEVEGGIFHQRFRRFFFSSADTTFYRLLQFGSHLKWTKQSGPLKFETGGLVSYNHIDPDRDRSLSAGNWTDAAARLNGELNPVSRIYINTAARMEYRSDGFLTGGAGAGIRINPEHGPGMNLYVSTGTYAPTIQQLYWRDSPYAGNPDLDAVEILRADLELSWRNRRQSGAGVRGYASKITGDILMNTDSTFTSVPEYYSLGGEFFAALNTTNWEIDLSSTVLLYQSDQINPQNLLLEGSGTRLRNRASIYRKGYLFDYATYVKAGLHGMISPASYRAAGYNPALDWWDIAPDAAPVPAHYRVDIDVTARIRSLFLMMKYENLFDQLGQSGYFESPFYPMPGRRFMLGIRWVLRN